MLRNLSPIAFLFAGCAVIVAASVVLYPLKGFAAECDGRLMRASWYGMETCAGKRDCRTADGTRFNGEQLLVAHRTLPFGTKLKITYKGKTSYAVVRDRGPAKWTGKDIDLSRAVADRLGFTKAGVGTVCVKEVR
jgi:rare lipoprotein A